VWEGFLDIHWKLETGVLEVVWILHSLSLLACFEWFQVESNINTLFFVRIIHIYIPSSCYFAMSYPNPKYGSLVKRCA
jgi:hypothetical protein